MTVAGLCVRKTAQYMALFHTGHLLNGSRHTAIHIGVLAYADDICLLAELIDDVEFSLHRFETSAAEIGQAINHNKTKAMHLGQSSVRHVCFANGDPVDSCDKL